MRTDVNGIEIEYETFGDPADPPLLLVMGLGAQMIAWDDEFCQGLVDRGFFVIRFDNRDVGLSTKVDGRPRDRRHGRRSPRPWRGGTPDAPVPAGRHGRRRRRACSTHLGIDQAHVVRRVDGRHDRPDASPSPAPERVLTLTSIMSTTGDPDVGQPHPEVLGGAHGPAGHRPRRGYIAQSVAGSRAIGSPEHFDEARATEHGRPRLRPLLLPGRRGPSAAGHRRPRPAAPRPCAARRAHAGHPRRRRSAGRPVGRASARPRSSPAPSCMRARGHGPRPARRTTGRTVIEADHRPAPPARPRWPDHGQRTPGTARAILEIAGIGPGPFAAMMLADMGADVIRVDRAAVGQRRRPRRPAGRRAEPRPPLGRRRPEEPRRASRRCSRWSRRPTR